MHLNFTLEHLVILFSEFLFEPRSFNCFIQFVRVNRIVIMAKLKRILFISISMVLLRDFVLCASVDGLEKRVDQDSYIDALHKTHAEDSLHCEFAIQ